MDYGPVWIDQAAGAKGYVKPVASAYDPSYKAPQQSAPAPSGGGGGGGGGKDFRTSFLESHGRYPTAQETPGYSGPSQADVNALAERQRGEISSGYDQYFGELDAMLGELPSQRTAQEDIVGSQFTQGVADLGAEKELGLADLGQQRTRTESSQAKNLADLAESIRNQFTAGQVALGARGAGDSSAVNQYSYALSKLGSKARGDVMSQTSDIMSEIDNREFKLNTVFSNEKTRLGSERDQKISSIAQWFSEATNQIRQMKAQGQISKGQDLASITNNLLNQAMQQAQQVQAAYLNRQGMLEQWALNNQQSIQQARDNISTQANYSPIMPQAGAIAGQPIFSGSTQNVPIFGGGGGGSDEEKYRPDYRA